MAQLRELGFDRHAVWRRVRSGLLHPLHRGVYAVGHARLTLHGRYLAAVLACGDGAVLSHRSAAALWELQPIPSGPIDVTVPGEGGRYRAGLRVHTTRSLAPAEIASRKGIPCTSVARTLLDVAATASPRAIDRLIEQAMILRIYDRNALDAVLAGGREGSRALRARLAKLQTEPQRFRSELERRFFELVRDAGLPLPIVNGLVEGHEVDFHWPAQRFIVETDGRATHDTPIAAERDCQSRPRSGAGRVARGSR